jgi:hypothetical protein
MHEKEIPVRRHDRKGKIIVSQLATDTRRFLYISKNGELQNLLICHEYLMRAFFSEVQIFAEKMFVLSI